MPFRKFSPNAIRHRNGINLEKEREGGRGTQN